MSSNQKDELFYSEDWNFSIRYPKGWEIMYQNESAGSWTIPIAVAGPRTNCGRACFMVNVRDGEILQRGNVVAYSTGPDGLPIKVPSSPKEYIQMNKDSLSREFDGFSFISGEELQMADKPAVRLVYSYRGQSSEITEESVTLFSLGRTFQFILELPSPIKATYSPVLKGILQSFSFGNPFQEISEANVAADSPVEQYNLAVGLYKQGKFELAQASFERVLTSQDYRLQSAYAIALCQEQRNIPLDLPLETEEEKDQAGKVYMSSNITAQLLSKKYPAIIPQNGEVQVMIDQVLYMIKVSSGFGFGGFFKMVWKKQGEKWIPVSDSGANPYPTPADRYILSLVGSNSLIHPCLFPEEGFKSGFSEVEFTSVESGPVVSKQTIESEPKVEVSVKTEPEKIGGWLLFPAFFIILQPLFVLNVYRQALFVGKMSGSFIYWPALVVNTIVLLVVLELGYLFFKRKSVAPAFYLLFLFFSLESWMILFLFLPPSKFVPAGYIFHGVEPAIAPFFVSLFWTLILGPAFLRSKRAEKTFTVSMDESVSWERMVLRFFSPCLSFYYWLKERRNWSFLFIPALCCLFFIVTLLVGTTVEWGYDQFLRDFFSSKKKVVRKEIVEGVKPELKEGGIQTIEPVIQDEQMRQVKGENSSFVGPVSPQINVSLSSVFDAGEEGRQFVAPVPNSLRVLLRLENLGERVWTVVPDMLAGEVYFQDAIMKGFCSKEKKEKREAYAPFYIDAFPNASEQRFETQVLFSGKGDLYTVVMTQADAICKKNGVVEDWGESVLECGSVLDYEWEVLSSMTFDASTKSYPGYVHCLLGPVMFCSDGASNSHYVFYSEIAGLMENETPYMANKRWICVDFDSLKDVMESPSFSVAIKSHFLFLANEVLESGGLEDYLFSNLDSFWQEDLKKTVIQFMVHNRFGIDSLLDMVKEHPDPFTRNAIVSCLKVLKDEKSIVTLSSLIRDEPVDETLRKNAFRSLCSMGELAWMYVCQLLAEPNLKDFSNLLPEFKDSIFRAAENNEPNAKLMAAYIYKNGIGVGKDLGKASEYCKGVSDFLDLAIDKKNQWEIILEAKLSEEGAIFPEQVIKTEQVAEEKEIEEKVVEIEIGTEESEGEKSFSQDATKKAAEEGDAKAQCRLGWNYTEGIGVPKDPVLALEWTVKAAEQGFAQAHNNLGVLYERGFGVPKDHGQALRCYEKAAELGNGQACCNVGLAYEYGRGVAVNHDEALKWYRKGADKGDGRSFCRLGSMYEDGLYVSKNFQEAYKNYLASAERGYVRGQYSVGVMYEIGKGVAKNYDEAFRWYKLSAEKGDSDAQQSLGRMYKNGWGVNKDYTQAMYWYQKAIDQGHPMAMCNMGWMYDRGLGVKQDLGKAFQWYLQGAEKGNVVCKSNVALMYDSGDGVEKNAEEALRWFRAAAEQGDNISQYHLGLKYQQGEGIEQNYSEAFKWFKLSADQKHAKAQYKVGLFYYYGYGVEKNLDAAANWFRLSADQGVETAQFTMGLLYQNGDGVPKDVTQALKWYRLSADQGNEDAKNALKKLSGGE